MFRKKYKRAKQIKHLSYEIKYCKMFKIPSKKMTEKLCKLVDEYNFDYFAEKYKKVFKI